MSCFALDKKTLPWQPVISWGWELLQEHPPSSLGRPCLRLGSPCWKLEQNQLPLEHPPHGAGLQGLAVPPALGGRCCQPDQVSCRHVSPQGPAPPPASLSLLMLQIHLLRRDGEENAPQSLYTHCKEGLNYTTSLAWYPTNMRTFIYS